MIIGLVVLLAVVVALVARDMLARRKIASGGRLTGAQERRVMGTIKPGERCLVYAPRRGSLLGGVLGYYVLTHEHLYMIGGKTGGKGKKRQLSVRRLEGATLLQKRVLGVPLGYEVQVDTQREKLLLQPARANAKELTKSINILCRMQSGR